MPILFAFLLVFCLSACANFSNPFDVGGENASETYFDQFPDIPIPSEMSVDRDSTLVSVTPDGTKSGMLVVQGQVERFSLARAVSSDMKKSGWTMLGQVLGPKVMHIYAKDNRHAVMMFYEQMLKTTMEIWVTMNLSDEAASAGVPTAGSTQPDFYLAPGAGSKTDNTIHQEGLSQ